MNDEPPRAERSEVETRMRAACDTGDHTAAATLVIEHYGGEILAFLRARLGSPSAGDDVFSTFAEKLWAGLPDFEWRCSLKAWAYRLARNAANDYASAAPNRARHNLALPSQPSASEFADRVRSTTAVYRKTPVKDRMRVLRETLDPDDQLLLILRVDRGLPWRDLAAALSDGTTLDGEELEREAARIRKRFERVKQQLRDLAVKEGLIPEEG